MFIHLHSGSVSRLRKRKKYLIEMTNRKATHRKTLRTAPEVE